VRAFPVFVRDAFPAVIREALFLELNVEDQSDATDDT
jgi:hypothetical protein